MDGFDVSAGIIILSFFAFIIMVTFDIWWSMNPVPTLNSSESNSTRKHEPATIGESFGKEMMGQLRNLGKIFYEEGLKKYFIPFIWLALQRLMNWFKRIWPAKGFKIV